MSNRKRIVTSTTVRVFATDDNRVGKIASQLFREEQLMYNEQRRQAKVKSWDKLCQLMKEQLPIYHQEQVLLELQ
jgi:hypothetical protein